MPTITIRVSQETLKRLRNLANKRKRPIAAVIEEAVRHLDRAEFWAEVNASYERLQADPVAWADYEAEMASLDGTLRDGQEYVPYEGIEELLEKAMEAEKAEGSKSA